MKDVEVPVAEAGLDAAIGAADALCHRVPTDRASALEALHSVASALDKLPGPDLLSAAERFFLIAQLDDDAMQACEHRLALADSGKDPEFVGAARDIFGALLDAYRQSLPELESAAGEAGADPALGECRGRLVRAGAQRVKWERCAGGPAHPALWRWLGAVFEHPDAIDPVASTPVSPTKRLSTIEREYVRAVAYYSAAPEHLSLPVLGAVDRLIDFALPMLLLQGGASQGAGYWISPELGAAPRRILRASEPATGNPPLRLLTRVAVGALHELAVQLQQGVAPARLDLRALDHDTLVTALHHLLRNWSDTPPVRRYRRHVLGGKLTAVRGIEDLRQLFTGESVSHLAEWEFRDASRGGIGATLRTGMAAPLAVGELVGILPHDGDTWQLGVVRRAWQEGDAVTRVGLEALSLRPVLASADDGLVRTDVLLCDPLLRGEAVRIAAPANTLRPGVPVFLTANGSIQKLKPLDAALAGEGFELRVYQVL